MSLKWGDRGVGKTFFILVRGSGLGLGESCHEPTQNTIQHDGATTANVLFLEAFNYEHCIVIHVKIHAVVILYL